MNTTEYPETVVAWRLVVPVVCLALFWMWETWRPLFGWRTGRLRHAARNIAIALFNTVILGLLFGTATVAVVHQTSVNGYGLLNAFGSGGPAAFVLGLVLLDAWMYVWHRANHTIPFLWRFHRMHHSDPRMDVTTATRFHIGEHLGGAVLRLALVPVIGWSIWQIVAYDLLVIAVTQFHHADISLGRADRWLRLILVTPDMHKVHHSRWQPETDSNYSTVLSVWDRLARSFRMRSDPQTIEFGLDEFDKPGWQTVPGMLRTPLAPLTSDRPPREVVRKEPEPVRVAEPAGTPQQRPPAV